MTDKFYDEARLIIQKLSPKEGDVIAINFPTDMAIQQIHSVVAYLNQVAEEFGCAIMCLGQGLTMEILTEEEMNRLGWYRKSDQTPRYLQ